MKALLVGAGAVGQVYGRHLQLGGVETSVYVKPKYAEEARRGYATFPLNRREPRQAAMHYKPNGVLTSIAEVADEKWDQVWLCVSSTALRSGWLEGFAKAIGEATVVMLQPGIDDREYLKQYVPEDRIVSGMVSLISYPAPLPGEKIPESGTAYWFPPLSPSVFSGPAERTRAVVDALKAGQMPAAVRPDVPSEVAFPSAALMAFITALEASDWSFFKLKHGERLKQACVATNEAAQVISKKIGKKPPFALKFVNPLFLRMALSLAPKAVPLDLETYFRVHFTKVGDQTRFFMKGYVQMARQMGLPAHTIEALARAVPKEAF